MTMRPIHRRSMLPIFFVASLALHLGLLAGSATTPDPAYRRLGQSALDVELASSLTTAARGKTRSPNPEHPHVPVRHDRVAAISQTVSPTSAIGHNVIEDSQTAVVSAGLRNQLLGELRTRLSEFLSYPVLARSRGWEGVVVLGVRIESDGRLDGLRVERGSGYAVLDHSALDSLGRVGRLSGAGDMLGGRRVDLLLPVVYRLAQN